MACAFGGSILEPCRSVWVMTLARRGAPLPSLPYPISNVVTTSYDNRSSTPLLSQLLNPVLLIRGDVPCQRQSPIEIQMGDR